MDFQIGPGVEYLEFGEGSTTISSGITSTMGSAIRMGSFFLENTGDQEGSFGLLGSVRSLFSFDASKYMSCELKYTVSGGLETDPDGNKYRTVFIRQTITTAFNTAPSFGTVLNIMDADHEYEISDISSNSAPNLAGLPTVYLANPTNIEPNNFYPVYNDGYIYTVRTQIRPNCVAHGFITLL